MCSRSQEDETQERAPWTIWKVELHGDLHYLENVTGSGGRSSHFIRRLKHSGSTSETKDIYMMMSLNKMARGINDEYRMCGARSHIWDLS